MVRSKQDTHLIFSLKSAYFKIHLNISYRWNNHKPLNPLTSSHCPISCHIVCYRRISQWKIRSEPTEQRKQKVGLIPIICQTKTAAVCYTSERFRMRVIPYHRLHRRDSSLFSSHFLCFQTPILATCGSQWGNCDDNGILGSDAM
jgi:hypothetical protein